MKSWFGLLLFTVVLVAERSLGITPSEIELFCQLSASWGCTENCSNICSGAVNTSICGGTCTDQRLTGLDLSGKKIKNVDKSIESLTTLESLSLSQNNILNLPNNIGNLKNLTFLDISHNFLTSVPKSFNQLTSLKTL